MAEQTPEPDFQRAMVVVAHPDDAEFMTAGTVARWTREGKEVVYVICTNGNKGSSDPEMLPARLAAIRQEEQREACRILGVSEVVFLGYEDGALRNTLELRRDIARQVRRFRPDLVLTQDPTMRWMGNSYLNHPDHRAAPDAALDAVYPSARDYHAFPELIAEGFMPHKTRYALVETMPEQANYWVDITDTMEQKIAALHAHRSQISPEDERVVGFVHEMGKWMAGERGMTYAECFRLIELRV